MSVPTFPCPNCGAPWPPEANVCPNCGHILPAGPPPPAGLGAAPPPAPKLVTGRAWGDLTLGIALSLLTLGSAPAVLTLAWDADYGFGLSGLIACVGFVVMPVLYFRLRPKYPVFARGIGYGLLASLVVFLGAFALCCVALALYQGEAKGGGG